MWACSAFLISFFILLVAVFFVVKLIYEGLNLFVCLLKCTVLLLCECWPLFSLAGLMYAIFIITRAGWNLILPAFAFYSRGFDFAAFSDLMKRIFTS